MPGIISKLVDYTRTSVPMLDEISLAPQAKRNNGIHGRYTVRVVPRYTPPPIKTPPQKKLHPLYYIIIYNTKLYFLKQCTFSPLLLFAYHKPYQLPSLHMQSYTCVLYTIYWSVILLPWFYNSPCHIELGKHSTVF